MKHINLIHGQNHTILTVYQTSDSFGSQHLEFVYEATDGTITRVHDAYDEGHWEDFSKDHMLEMWNSWLCPDELRKGLQLRKGDIS